MDLDSVVAPETLERIRRAKSGEDVRRRLRIRSLRPGDVGILRATVRSVAPPRAFRRKNGTEGLIGRVTLDDGTGDVEAVLWDDQNRWTRDGTLAPNQHVELQGIHVQEGWRGGIELSLEQATITQLEAPTTRTDLRGTVTAIAPTQVVDGRFQAEVELATDAGPAHVILWDDAVKDLRNRGLGSVVALQGVTGHPLLDDWYLADGAALS